jgi:hypothetical protein
MTRSLLLSDGYRLFDVGRSDERMGLSFASQSQFPRTVSLHGLLCSLAVSMENFVECSLTRKRILYELVSRNLSP